MTKLTKEDLLSILQSAPPAPEWFAEASYLSDDIRPHPTRSGWLTNEPIVIVESKMDRLVRWRAEYTKAMAEKFIDTFGDQC